MKRSLWAVPLTLLLVSQAWAGGFNIYEMGARATALGGAFTATADDGSAIFYNPAGLAWLGEGFHVSGDMALIMPTSKFQRADGVTATLWPGKDTAETKQAVFTPGGLYMSYGFDEQWSAGFGVFTPFGLGVEWEGPDTFAGRGIATNSQIQGFYISPVLTWHPTPDLALSGGVHAVITHLSLERILVGGTDLTSNLADFKLEGSSELAWGPAFGVMLRPNDRFSFGVNFKGGVTNSFEKQDAALSSRLDGSTTDAFVSGDLAYPSILSVGTRFSPAEKLDLMFDYVWIDWSVFDEVKLDFTVDDFDTTLEERYRDGHQWRFGAEYQYRENLSFLAGFVYDKSPQPRFSMTPLLPDADRRDYSVGVTWQRGSYALTAAYMLVDFIERSSVVDGVGVNPEGFDGTYNSVAHIPTFGFSKNF